MSTLCKGVARHILVQHCLAFRGLKQSLPLSQSHVLSAMESQINLLLGFKGTNNVK